MKFFRYVFIPALITMCFFYIVVKLSTRDNDHYQINGYNAASYNGYTSPGYISPIYGSSVSRMPYYHY